MDKYHGVLCDCCFKEMSDKEFEKVLWCSCDNCRPFTVCLACHKTFRKDDNEDVGSIQAK